MSARDKYDPTLDAGYLSSRRFSKSQTIDQPLAFVGESIYAMLGLMRLRKTPVFIEAWTSLTLGAIS
jgi:hypothetical protein